MGLHDFSDALQRGNYFAESAGCSNKGLSCLLSLEIDTILSAQIFAANQTIPPYILANGLPFAPSVDGVVLTDQVRMESLVYHLGDTER
jgi:hypothetical protein